MIVGHSRIGSRAFIIIANKEEFELHYNEKYKQFNDEHFLSRTYKPSCYPCAYEVMEYFNGQGRFTDRYYNTFLKPCEIDYAYHQIVDEWQAQINRQQVIIDDITRKYLEYTGQTNKNIV